MIAKKDTVIMQRLRVNARENLTTMSRKTGIPISTIFDRLKQHNFVRKYTVLFDFAKLGYHTHALISIKSNKESKEPLRRHLRCHSNVNSLYKINHGFDFLVEVVFRNIKELDTFIEHIENTFDVEGTQIQYLIDEITKEEFNL